MAAARSTEEKRLSSMTKLTLTREQHKAEIFWALKSVMSHFSYNSAHDITDVFKAMFPDSIIAQHMSCGLTKLSVLDCTIFHGSATERTEGCPMFCHLL